MSGTIHLLNRTTIAAAILVGGVAVSSAALAQSDDEPRSELFIGVDACPTDASAGAISVSYDDLVDGHTPQAVTERLADQSGELWSTTEIHQVDGDYFNVHNFPATAAIPITDESEFAYSVAITYDDGVTLTQWVDLSIAEQCEAGSPTTTAPPTTAPAGSRFAVGRASGDCSDGLSNAEIAFGFTDAVDGHVPTEYAFHLSFGDRLYGHYDGPTSSDGETFEVAVPGVLWPIQRLEATTYTLTMWVKYEDGVVVSDVVSYDVAALCDVDDPATTRPSSAPTTTTAPSGTLPQTGSSMTTGIAAIGGLLAATGSALVLGVRRRRTA